MKFRKILDGFLAIIDGNSFYKKFSKNWSQNWAQIEREHSKFDENSNKTWHKFKENFQNSMKIRAKLAQIERKLSKFDESSNKVCRQTGVAI
jgi:RNA polymerase-binding transcription factor DksA